MEKNFKVPIGHIPNDVEEFFWSQNGKKFNVNSRLGDSPAFSENINDNGLTSIVYISKPSFLTYDTMEKFEKFANHKDLDLSKNYMQALVFRKKLYRNLSAVCKSYRGCWL